MTSQALDEDFVKTVLQSLARRQISPETARVMIGIEIAEAEKIQANDANEAGE